MDPVSLTEALWHPPASAFTESNLARYQRWVSEHYGIQCSNYHELYDWSVTQIELFWRSIAEYFAVQFRWQPEKGLVGEKPLGAHWFPGGTLNYAAHLLRWQLESPDRVAIIARTESKPGGRVQADGAYLLSDANNFASDSCAGCNRWISSRVGHTFSTSARRSRSCPSPNAGPMIQVGTLRWLYCGYILRA
jgi:hypothetical protein